MSDVTEVNCETGEITIRPQTQDEIDFQSQLQAEHQAALQEKAQKDAATAAQLSATNDKLMALGLTPTDINALLNAAKST